ncbi:hypothetical protein P0D71_00340 [Paraburkholderia sp. RL17-383-BIF-A]|uniref:hypothetical protein n=1 Tax=Paraburkholderia sp. RL17-383-BIF-A TaxID=3031631 RepID=UPI0038BD2916
MTATQPEGLDMTSLTDEQIDALAREHRIYVKRGEETIFHGLNTLTKIRAFARALLAAAPAQSAVPVAWRAPNLSGSGDIWAYRDADDRFEGVNGEPTGEALYTAPQPSPTAVVLDERGQDK